MNTKRFTLEEILNMPVNDLQKHIDESIEFDKGPLPTIVSGIIHYKKINDAVKVKEEVNRVINQYYSPGLFWKLLAYIPLPIKDSYLRELFNTHIDKSDREFGLNT